MNLIIFGIISIAIFVIITIIGLFIAMNKKDTSSVNVLAFTENANNLTLVKAIPSPNKYVNFDEILDMSSEDVVEVEQTIYITTEDVETELSVTVDVWISFDCFCIRHGLLAQVLKLDTATDSRAEVFTDRQAYTSFTHIHEVTMASVFGNGMVKTSVNCDEPVV